MQDNRSMIFSLKLFWRTLFWAALFVVFATIFSRLAPAQTQTGCLQVGWDSNTESDLAGYRIYYGIATRQYDHVLDVGNVTQFTIRNLDSSRYYYLALTAYDLSGNESDFSAEVSGFPSLASAAQLEVLLLFQNYPNPFNPETTISYFLIEETPVLLRIITPLGQTVKVLVKQKQSAGTHYTNWDGTDESGTLLASGIYFALLEIKNYHLSRPLVFVH